MFSFWNFRFKKIDPIFCWISSLLWGFFSTASSSKPSTQSSNSTLKQWTKKHFVDVIQFTPCTIIMIFVIVIIIQYCIILLPW